MCHCGIVETETESKSMPGQTFIRTSDKRHRLKCLWGETQARAFVLRGFVAFLTHPRIFRTFCSGIRREKHVRLTDWNSSATDFRWCREFHAQKMTLFHTGLDLSWRMTTPKGSCVPQGGFRRPATELSGNPPLVPVDTTTLQLKFYLGASNNLVSHIPDSSHLSSHKTQTELKPTPMWALYSMAHEHSRAGTQERAFFPVEPLSPRRRAEYRSRTAQGRGCTEVPIACLEHRVHDT